MSLKCVDLENYLYENYLGKCIAVEFTSGDCCKKAIGVLKDIAPNFIRLVSNAETYPFINITVLTRNNPPLQECSREVIIIKNNITAVELEPYFDNNAYKVAGYITFRDNNKNLNINNDENVDEIINEIINEIIVEDISEGVNVNINENIGAAINKTANEASADNKVERKVNLPQTDAELMKLLREIEETAHQIQDESGRDFDDLAEVNFLSTEHGSMFFKPLLPERSDLNNIDDSWVEELDEISDNEK